MMQDKPLKRLSRDEAEALAVEALTFIASDPEILARFLDVSGLRPDTLRSASADPGFLVGVLEFMMADEATLLVFSQTRHIRPTLFAAARYTLSSEIGDQDDI